MSLLLTYAALPLRTVRADIAPPEQPPGSSLAPGDETTQVVMQSEQVVITVQPDPWRGELPAEEESRGVTRDWARVEAHFVMRNGGSHSESMTARFPLSAPLFSESAAGEIQGLTVEVNGRATATRRIEARYPMPEGTDAPTIGWAAFDVLFPPGVDVRIDVAYPLRATGYANQDSRFVYVLGTGAGWSGAIGRADMVVKLPYPASRENIVDYDAAWMSAGYAFDGSQIVWRYQDIEPTADQVVVATLVAQDLWDAVLRAEPGVLAHPDDGEAWGTLARALKLAVCTEKGYWPRQDVGGTLLVERSIAAYERATEFAPHEARWQAGYAELLIKLVRRDDASDPLLQRAVEHLNLALTIEPKNDQALQVLEDLRSFPVIEVEQTDAGPHIILRSGSPTARATVEPAAATPSVTSSPPSSVPTHTSTPAKSATTSSSPGPCAGSALALALTAPLLVLSTRRAPRKRQASHPSQGTHR